MQNGGGPTLQANNNFGWSAPEPSQHPSTADATHTHARAGLQERNGPNPTRKARAPRPATSQHRVGRRRRGSDERQRTLLFARELLDTFQQRELRCRYFLLVRSLGVGLGVALEDPNRARQTPPTQRSTPTCLPNPSRKKIRPLSWRPPTAPFVGGAPPPPMWAPPHRLRRVSAGSIRSAFAMNHVKSILLIPSQKKEVRS